MKSPRLTPVSADPSLEPCSREPRPPLESVTETRMKLGAPHYPGAPHQSSQQQREFTVRTEVQGVARRSRESHHFKAFSKGAPVPWCQGCQSLQGPFLTCLRSGDSRIRLWMEAMSEQPRSDEAGRDEP